MAENDFNNVVNSMIKGMDGFLSTKTVVGEATTIGDTILVPFVDVSFGVGTGSFSNDKKNNGVGALSGKMSPSAVLVINNGTTRLVNIRNQSNLDKIVDMVPDLVNKFASKKGESISDEEAAKQAFNKDDATNE